MEYTCFVFILQAYTYKGAYTYVHEIISKRQGYRCNVYHRQRTDMDVHVFIFEDIFELKSN